MPPRPPVYKPWRRTSAIELTGKKVQILCGPGNNGGDGAALALQLASLGVQTDVILFGTVSDTSGDARHNFEAVSQLANKSASPAELNFIECRDAKQWQVIASDSCVYDVIVDALFGTGSETTA